MVEDEHEDDRGVSRRELLKRAGLLGAVALVPPSTLSHALRGQAPAAPWPPAREALETLTAAEADLLEAVVARLIPSDEHGPGAAEARAAHYIDRALAGPLADLRQTYAAGLAAVDAYAQTAMGAPFARLSPGDQDVVLSDMERNTATGFVPDAASFFNLVRTHTIQGTFCDPYYGGNASFVGWDLIRYPGVRLAVAADEPRAGEFEPNHRSAYDYDAFTKRPAASEGGARHGR